MNKLNKPMLIKVSPTDARRLYHKGMTIYTSQDEYTMQGQANQQTHPVEDSFFQQRCLYGLMILEEEAKTIRNFQKQGIIKMIVAGVSGITCIHSLFLFQFFHNYWFLGGFLGLSYLSVHFWVRVFDDIKPENNPYLQVLKKYGISLHDEDL